MAAHVRELVAGHPHPLKGARFGQFSLDLHGGIRLVFRPKHRPVPVFPDEGIDWAQVTRVLGSSARFWLVREVQYRETIARQNEFDKLIAQAGWLKQLPLADMFKFGWMKKFTHKGHQVAECLQYFGVSSVAIWQKRYAEPIAAFKASNKFEKKRCGGICVVTPG